MLFHLVIHKDKDSAYGVAIPTLKGTFSAGNTLEEAVNNAKEAILFQLEGLLEDHIDPVFENLTLDKLKNESDNTDAIFVSIDVDVAKYSLKPERFNVSWPKNVLRQVDDFVERTHDNRSNFLAKAAFGYMQGIADIKKEK